MLHRVLRRRRSAALLTALCLAATAFVTQSYGSRIADELRASAHQPVLAQTATKRPLGLLDQRSLISTRLVVQLPIVHRQIARTEAIVSRSGPPLPPARMRYRRCSHSADDDPPA